MSGSISQYPWYEDGDRAADARSITRLPRATFNRRGQVCLAEAKDDPDTLYMLKAVLKGSQEAVNFTKFDALRQSSRNRIIPAEVVECENSLLVIMPRLTTFMQADGFHNQVELMNAFTKVMEGLEFMHEHDVAFVDIAADNLVFARKACKFKSYKIATREVFFIDYGSSRQMSSGPGSGATIQDYMQMGGHFDPPEGTSNLDPFAYDIFALGETIDDLFSLFTMGGTASDIKIGPSLRGFIDVLSNPIPARRPTIKQAIKLWLNLINWHSVLNLIILDDGSRRDALDTAGWHIILSRYLQSL